MIFEFRSASYDVPILRMGQIERVAKIERLLGELTKKQAASSIEEWDKLNEEMDRLYSQVVDTIFSGKGPTVKRSELTVRENEALESFFVELAEDSAEKSRKSNPPSQSTSVPEKGIEDLPESMESSI